MSARGLPSGMNAALAASYVQWFPLVHMALDSGDLYVSGAPFDVDYDGQTWLSVMGFGSVETISETAQEQAGLAFSLSGIPDAAVALVLGEKFQSRAVTLKMAVVDHSTDPPSLLVEPATWQGLLDVPMLEDGDSPTVRITAEHQMVAWDQPNGATSSDAWLQQAQPGCKFYEHTAALVESTIVWPSAAAQRSD